MIKILVPTVVLSQELLVLIISLLRSYTEIQALPTFRSCLQKVLQSPSKHLLQQLPQDLRKRRGFSKVLQIDATSILPNTSKRTLETEAEAGDIPKEEDITYSNGPLNLPIIHLLAFAHQSPQIYSKIFLTLFNETFNRKASISKTACVNYFFQAPLNILPQV